MVKPGLYVHFKGKQYLVLDTAFDCATTEQVVVYQAMYEDKKLFTRPLAEFEESVTRDGITQPRFKYIGCKFSNFVEIAWVVVFAMRLPQLFFYGWWNNGFDKTVQYYRELVARTIWK